MRAVEFESTVAPFGQIALPPEVASEIPPGEAAPYRGHVGAVKSRPGVAARRAANGSKPHTPEDAVYEQLIGDAAMSPTLRFPRLIGMFLESTTSKSRTRFLPPTPQPQPPVYNRVRLDHPLSRRAVRVDYGSSSNPRPALGPSGPSSGSTCGSACRDSSHRPPGRRVRYRNPRHRRSPSLWSASNLHHREPAWRCHRRARPRQRPVAGADPARASTLDASCSASSSRDFHPRAAELTATLNPVDSLEDGTPDFLRLDDETDRQFFSPLVSPGSPRRSTSRRPPTGPPRSTIAPALISLRVREACTRTIAAGRKPRGCPWCRPSPPSPSISTHTRPSGSAVPDRGGTFRPADLTGGAFRAVRRRANAVALQTPTRWAEMLPAPCRATCCSSVTKAARCRFTA